jgi:hypothetical protein
MAAIRSSEIAGSPAIRGQRITANERHPELLPPQRIENAVNQLKVGFRDATGIELQPLSAVSNIN